MNERQQITASKYGTSLIGEFGFDNYGLPMHIKAKVGTTYRQDYRYNFNGYTRNLTTRTNGLKTETFGYDTGNLDRLVSVTGTSAQTIGYDPTIKGNITAKNPGGITNYKYENSAKPYQLTGIETPVTSPQLVSDVQQNIIYTSFEQPATITELPYQALFTCNSGGQRAKMEVKQNSSTILTRWYAGSSYMKETKGSTTNEFTWIGGDAYSAPILAVKQGTTTTYYYLLRDHLGTITHVTNTSGTVLNEYSYDACSCI